MKPKKQIFLCILQQSNKNAILSHHQRVYIKFRLFNRNSAFKLCHFLWNGVLVLIDSQNKSEFHSNTSPYYPIELIYNTISIVIFIQVYCCYWWAFFRYLEKFQSIFFASMDDKYIEINRMFFTLVPFKSMLLLSFWRPNIFKSTSVTHHFFWYLF